MFERSNYLTELVQSCERKCEERYDINFTLLKTYEGK